MQRIVIADAGPLIALARIKQLDLLPGLFGQVLVIVDEARGRMAVVGIAVASCPGNSAKGTNSSSLFKSNQNPLLEAIETSMSEVATPGMARRKNETHLD